MIDLTFITSNKAKMAHALYMGRNYDVNIVPYKNFYYGNSYCEPRIEDRTRLLDSSFGDALSRWRKRGLDKHFFFIEDTSVKINAISFNGREVPGVDIKYWMEGKTFDVIDNLLKEHGNDRSAIVSSHIMLYIPAAYRKMLHITTEYQVFVSFVCGRVTEEEVCLDTQYAYPWLDNKTFNKWFIPDGCNRPLSTLNINEANLYDFRRGAFEDMLAFMHINKKEPIIHKLSVPLTLPFVPSFVICGQMCVGKSSVGQYLANNYGFYHIEASQFMTMRFWEFFGPETTMDIHKFAEDILREDPLFVVKQIVTFLEKKKITSKFVITGLRTPSEIEYLVSVMSLIDLQYVYMDANEDIRYARWKKRHRENEQHTQNRFAEICKLQDGMGVKRLADEARMYHLTNNYTELSELYSAIDLRWNLKETEKNVKVYNVASKATISLEKSILYVLYHNLGKRKYLTTNEISQQIKKLLGVEKNKNNISRYFHQKYYPYYEINYNQEKTHYRLSSIGVSEVKRLMLDKL